MSPKLFNLLLVLLPVVLYFGYIEPAYTGNPGFVWTPTNSIKALQSQNVQYQNTLNQIDLIKDGMSKLEKDYNAVPLELREKINIMMPDTVDPVKLRNEIIYIGNQSDVAIQGLKVEKDLMGDKGLNFYLVSFGIKARYPAFKKFMTNYEKNMRFFILESATIQRQEKKEGDPNAVEIDDEEALIINVTSRVYYMK